MESLAELFIAILKADDDLSQEREKLQLDGERLFQDIDSMRVGYFYMNSFARWVNINCGFIIQEDDLVNIQARLNRSNAQSVRRDDFILNVNAEALEED